MVRASQAAEKLAQEAVLKGHGFSRAEKPQIGCGL
jgi:hypothetical protein